tara:strand:- start:209 stop:499 length:291 start_codon:yes stop_codon:yes gene_type:complete
MSTKTKVNHIANIPDCSMMILVTHDGIDIQITCGDFVSPDVKDSKEHEMIKDIGASMMEMVQDVIGYAIEETEEPTTVDVKDNVIYLNKKIPPTKH